ncbi:dihydrolipoamide acetyltransferase component of pyruvate dehydrogenase complex [Vulcanimicrobium alpinum]|uniref:Dihydrolipoamide acetyltransferase component of pyruvate dehydrogenase complex n=1 Tax=Vulcanimicrobium alpinum TaxID=3016050 RepID=A0AAN2C985_UNVUL|nr:dihydrolipoamide acetyltransferase family protein [Vulcanimicrobium alpinum]BDE05728.1 dihydrolipoamide acetyltransferase component of pyruvate dehydrogenase complex [Vulcanimicrobium alpinum]
MPAEVVMPKLGLTMESGTIARWIKTPGEHVRAGEPLVEVSTDKISYEVESPATGTVVRALGSDGDEFACGDVIGLIAVAGESETPEAAAAAAPRERVVETPLPATSPAAESVHHAVDGGRTIASPAARRLARERGVALREVRGTGPRGRITMADVAERAERRPPQPERVPSRNGFPPQLPIERRAIYRKMTDVASIPLAQVETVAVADAVKALIDARRDFRWTAFAVFAIARLLREHDRLRIDASTGAPFEALDIGVAADTPQGLIVPVVRDAGSRSLAEIEHEIQRLATAARSGTLRPDDLGGACFSLSNVGPQGIERVAPLPDPPQTAILGIGAATQRPAVVDGTLRAATMLTCVLTFDHRHVDGAPAARFLADFARACAAPGVLL